MLDPSIIMQGQGLDAANALYRGAIMGNEVGQIARQNALTGFMRENGQQIMAGDQNALARLAQFDPNMAFEVQNNLLGQQDTRQGMAARDLNMQATRQQMRIMDDQQVAQLRQQAAELSAAEVEAERQQARQLGAQFSTIRDPQQWDALAAQANPEWVGQFDNREFIFAGLMDADDVLSEALSQGGVNPDNYRVVGDSLVDLGAQGGPAPVYTAPPSPDIRTIGDSLVRIDPAGGATSIYTTPQQPEIRTVGDSLVRIDPTGGVAPLYAAPPSPDTVVNTGDNTSAFTERAGELAADRYDEYLQVGAAASVMQGDMQQLAALASQINTGVGAQLTAAFGPIARQLGVSVDGLDEIQAFDAIINRLAPQMRPVGSGATTNFDAEMFLKSLPSLGRTPEGNALINATFQAVQQHQLAAAGIARQVMSGQISWQQGDAEIAALGNPYEAFNRARDGLQGAPAAPGAGPTGGVPDFAGMDMSQLSAIDTRTLEGNPDAMRAYLAAVQQFTERQ